MVGHSIGTRERVPAGKVAIFYHMPNFWRQELGTMFIMAFMTFDGTVLI